MDLQDQLKNLFPDHVPQVEPENTNNTPDMWIQDKPLLCKYEKRKGKPTTIIDGYNGAKSDFKTLASLLKKELNVGGGIKNEQIVIQGDYREQIMQRLIALGFQVKRVGG